jgi:hypothetical protein
MSYYAVCTLQLLDLPIHERTKRRDKIIDRDFDCKKLKVTHRRCFPAPGSPARRGQLLISFKVVSTAVRKKGATLGLRPGPSRNLSTTEGVFVFPVGVWPSPAGSRPSTPNCFSDVVVGRLVEIS